jgi:hypothetical protein
LKQHRDLLDEPARNLQDQIESNRRRPRDGIRGSQDRGIEPREDRPGIDQRRGEIETRNRDGSDFGYGKLRCAFGQRKAKRGRHMKNEGQGEAIGKDKGSRFRTPFSPPLPAYEPDSKPPRCAQKAPED